ncbi:hypothetical protein M569_13343, partial [Genlisea aurea]
MASGERYFVEWKEQFVSKERGNRVVHYFLKDNSGESVLAIVGTERSVRHMFYVVADEFLNSFGARSSITSGFRWRSRREVVNWLTSTLSKQHRSADYSCKALHLLFIVFSPSKSSFLSSADKEGLGRSSKNSKSHHLGIAWSGSAWTCGKQLKHYLAFHRNGTSIAVQSFVFVMAEKENRYIAYLEDMYEDRKCQKKVKVRWFHYYKEVKGVVALRDPHLKEVFITPYVQVISAECVDGPAIVLSREHYRKCHSVFPHKLLTGVHFCFRQFKSNRVRPFKLSRLCGYFDQPIFSCFSADFFEEEEEEEEEDEGEEGFSSGEDGILRGKGRAAACFPCRGGDLQSFPSFAVEDKVEFLCQDSGIRGCWFRCTVLEVASRKMKVRYDDIKVEDSDAHLQEWIPTFREAKPDRLKLRRIGRPTLRPACPCRETILRDLDVGVSVDVWWSDGWWEGVVSSKSEAEVQIYRIYLPGESMYLNAELTNIRISRDWVGDRWVDIEPDPDFMRWKQQTENTKLSTLLSIVEMDSMKSSSPVSPPSSPKTMTLADIPLDEENDENCSEDSGGGDDEDDDMAVDRNVETDDEEKDLVECEIAELKYEDDAME